MNLHNIVIVLARPEESRNVGAVCRAMANSALHELRIVGSRADYDDEHVCRLAIHAAPIWERAQFFASITAATADCALSAATTRRRGKKRTGKLLLPEELAALASRVTGAPLADGGAVAADGAHGCSDGGEAPVAAGGGKVAVVFGNERTGLTDGEMAECMVGVTIPAAAEFASLNLSHAVQIIAYELYRAQAQVSAGSVPVPLLRLDAAVTRIADSLQKIGFFSVTGRADMERFWRMVLSRAALSEGEAAYIEKVFDKAAGLALRR